MEAMDGDGGGDGELPIHPSHAANEEAEKKRRRSRSIWRTNKPLSFGGFFVIKPKAGLAGLSCGHPASFPEIEDEGTAKNGYSTLNSKLTLLLTFSLSTLT